MLTLFFETTQYTNSVLHRLVIYAVIALIRHKMGKQGMSFCSPCPFVLCEILCFTKRSVYLIVGGCHTPNPLCKHTHDSILLFFAEGIETIHSYHIIPDIKCEEIVALRGAKKDIMLKVDAINSAYIPQPFFTI